DGQAPCALQRGEEVVAGKVVVQFLLRVAVVNDAVYQPQRLRAAYLAAYLLLENGMVYAGEVLADVALQHIVVGLHKLRQPVYRRMGSLAFAAGIRIMDKDALKDRLDEIAEGMMHDPVSVERSADLAILGILNGEGTVSAWFV